MSPAIRPRDAASVIVLRDGPDGGLEVLMIRRHEGSADFAGASVFPGGNVEPEDEAASSPRLGAGLDAAQARRELGEDASDDAIRALHVAACRELEEEAGLVVTADRLAAFARWVTPSHLPRRWDTRFFLAPEPSGQTARPDGGEASEAIWTTPRRALADYAEGRHVLAPPTVRLLHELDRFDSAEEAFADARRDPGVFPVLPVRLAEAPLPTLLFPGDREHPQRPGKGLDRVVLRDGRWTWSGLTSRS